jgi:hypothetical protein
MSENKSKNFLALLSHGLVYTGMLTYMIVSLGVRIGLSPTDMLLYVGLNGVAHVCVDGISSRITSYFWHKKNVHVFFCVIGLDQFIHFAILYGTMGRLSL